MRDVGAGEFGEFNMKIGGLRDSVSDGTHDGFGFDTGIRSYGPIDSHEGRTAVGEEVYGASGIETAVEVGQETALDDEIHSVGGCGKRECCVFHEKCS